MDIYQISALYEEIHNPNWSPAIVLLYYYTILRCLQAFKCLLYRIYCKSIAEMLSIEFCSFYIK